MNLGNGRLLLKHITPLVQHEQLIRQRFDLEWQDVEYLGQASEWYRKFKRGMSLSSLMRCGQPKEVILFRCFCYYMAMQGKEIKTVFEMVRWWESFDAERVREEKRLAKNAAARDRRHKQIIANLELKAANKLVEVDRAIETKIQRSQAKPLKPWEIKIAERLNEEQKDLRKY